MFSYVIIENPILVQIKYGENVIDESGPWESLPSAVMWASAYVEKLNSGVSDPILPA